MRISTIYLTFPLADLCPLPSYRELPNMNSEWIPSSWVYWLTQQPHFLCQPAFSSRDSHIFGFKFRTVWSLFSFCQPQSHKGHLNQARLQQSHMPAQNSMHNTEHCCFQALGKYPRRKTTDLTNDKVMLSNK